MLIFRGVPWWFVNKGNTNRKSEAWWPGQEIQGHGKPFFWISALVWCLSKKPSFEDLFYNISTDTNVDTIEQKDYILFSIIHNSYIKSCKAKASGQRHFSAASSFTQHRIHAAHCHVQISTVEEPYPDRQQCVWCNRNSVPLRRNRLLVLTA